MEPIESFARAYLDAGGECEENAGLAAEIASIIHGKYPETARELGYYLYTSEGSEAAMYYANVVFETKGDGGVIDIPEGETPEKIIERNPELVLGAFLLRFIALYPLYSGDPTASREAREKARDPANY